MIDLDALKTNPAVFQIYERYTSLKRASNKSWAGICPLNGHSEKSPSFNVFEDMRFQCFGCGRAGNIFQFLQDVENMEFKDAVEKVKETVGSKSEWSAAKDKVDSVFKPVAEPKTYKTIPLSAWEKVENALKSSLPAIKYLQEQRGIELATAQQLRLGFVQNIGSLAGEDGKDIADKGWLAFPSIEGDKIVSVKYRSLVRKKPGGFARQPGMATSLWNTESIDPFEPVYVTEGEFDACILESAGLHAVSVPSAGVKPTPAMKDQLMKASCVILAGDNDGGVGSSYMEKLWREMGSQTYLLKWPDGIKDANEAFLKHCFGDQEKFVQLMDELTTTARSRPMPSVYSLQEILRNGENTALYEHPDRLRFPWSGVDKMVNVLPGDVLGVGSTNTSMGKSTWVLQLTMYNARKYGRTFLNYQTEMRPSAIATMAAAQVARKDRNFLSAEDKKLAANELDGVQYFVGNDPLLSDINAVLDLLEAAIKRLSPYGVCLDHFHHLTTGMNNETQVQSAAMTRIKSIAETYKVVFINVGQPRKATQQTKGKQIHITDFKGSGAWGDASDAVIAIHRDLNKSEDLTTSKGVYEDKTLIKLLKGRSMGTGASACYLTAFGEFASFEEIDTTHMEEPG